jgi:hypothetical protein
MGWICVGPIVQLASVGCWGFVRARLGKLVDSCLTVLVMGILTGCLVLRSIAGIQLKPLILIQSQCRDVVCGLTEQPHI